MRRRARDHDVVALRHVEGPEDRLDPGAAALEVDALVADPVAIVGTRGVGHDVEQADVGIAEDEPPTRDDVDTGLQAGR